MRHVGIHADHREGGWRAVHDHGLADVQIVGGIQIERGSGIHNHRAHPGGSRAAEARRSGVRVESAVESIGAEQMQVAAAEFHETAAADDSRYADRSGVRTAWSDIGNKEAGARHAQAVQAKTKAVAGVGRQGGVVLDRHRTEGEELVGNGSYTVHGDRGVAIHVHIVACTCAARTAIDGGTVAAEVQRAGVHFQRGGGGSAEGDDAAEFESAGVDDDL